MTILTGSFVVCILAAGCDFSMGDANVTLTNATGQVIRMTGSCIRDDPHTVNPGEMDNYLYLGANCRIDNGDGLDGIPGCVTLSHRHTALTMAKLRKIAGPDDCWGSGKR